MNRDLAPRGWQFRHVLGDRIAYFQLSFFFKLQNAKGMPDNAALFALQVSDKEHLVSSLKAKGLDIAG